MSRNFLMQKVNFFIAATFIAAFGLLVTSKVLDAAKLSNPIIEATAATENALAQN